MPDPESAQRVPPAVSDADREDDLLARRARDGDLAAFNQLVARHQDAAYSLARRFLGAPQPAEDVTQEAFLRAYRRIETFRGGRFRAWILQITANLARDELRRRARRPAVSLDAARDDPDRAPLDPPEPGLGPAEQAENSELRRRLERALAELPDDWRLVVLLSDVHGCSYPEIAETTGLALGTVKSRLSRARARLRDLLQEGDPFDAERGGEPHPPAERPSSRGGAV